jgi:hypothetical protein
LLSNAEKIQACNIDDAQEQVLGEAHTFRKHNIFCKLWRIFSLHTSTLIPAARALRRRYMLIEVTFDSKTVESKQFESGQNE